MSRNKLTLEGQRRVKAIQVVQQAAEGDPFGYHSYPRGLFRVVGAGFVGQAIGMRNKSDLVHGEILTESSRCVLAMNLKDSFAAAAAGKMSCQRGRCHLSSKRPQARLACIFPAGLLSGFHLNGDKK